MTGKAEHTAGPWEVIETIPGITYRGTIREVGPRPYVAMSGKNVVAYVPDEANAHLIAAAPAMYEALRALEQFTDGLVLNISQDREQRYVVCEQARAAIRLVEGGE